MMDRVHPSLTFTGITLANPLAKTNGQTTTTTSEYLGQLSAVIQQQQQQQHNQDKQQQQQQQEELPQTTQEDSSYNSILHNYQTINPQTAYSVRGTTAPTSSSLSSLLHHTTSGVGSGIKNSGSHLHHQHHHHHHHTQHPHTHTHPHTHHTHHHHLSEEQVYAHLPSHTYGHPAHQHTPTHYALNHLHQQNQRAIATNSSPSSRAVETPTSVMAVAAAAHLHHNPQTSPMTNLHQNMGSLINSGSSAR